MRGDKGFPDLDAKEIGQMETALRHVGDREVLFARSVILVEDESQRDFLVAVAPTLGYPLDTMGVSVIQVDGEQGYEAYFTLLRIFRIPFVVLKDLAWGDDSRYPADQYFSLGMELEDYLDDHGLKDIRFEVMKDVGKSKRRVAYELSKVDPEIRTGS